MSTVTDILYSAWNKDSASVKAAVDDIMSARAADVVADPSAPDACVRGIMEGVEWVWDNGLLKAQKLEEMKKTIQKTSSRNLEEQKIKVFKQFIDSL